MTTEGVSRSRQYDRWRELVNATHQAWDMPRGSGDGFLGSVHRRTLGQGEILFCVCDPCKGRRGRLELAASAEPMVGVLFVLAGEEKLTSRGNDVFLRPGFFTVWDTTQPLAFETSSRLRKLTLLLPAAQIENVLGTAHRPPTTQALDARIGCGTVLLEQLQSLVRMPQELDAASQEVVLQTSITLLAATIRPQLKPAAVVAERIVARAEAHIIRWLQDPELTIESVARVLGISRRQLDRAFAESGRSVSRFIWFERLEHCRQDILLEHAATLSEIAFRWGFSDAGHFSRAFRRAYGITPTQYRGRWRTARSAPSAARHTDQEQNERFAPRSSAQRALSETPLT